MEFLTAEALKSARLDQARAQYVEYLDSLGDLIPCAIQASARQDRLRQAKLAGYRLVVNSKRLGVHLIGEPDENASTPVLLSLRYSGVELFQCVATETICSEGILAFGRLAWDEFAWIGTGLFEHRILFSTGFTLVAHFRDFIIQSDENSFSQ